MEINTTQDPQLTPAPKKGGGLSKFFYLVAMPIAALVLSLGWYDSASNPDATFGGEVTIWPVLLALLAVGVTASFCWDYFHKGQRFDWSKWNA